MDMAVITDMEDIMENRAKNNTDTLELLDITIILDDMWRGFKKFFWLCLLLIIAFSVLFFMRARSSYSPRYEAYSSFVVQAKTAFNYGSSYDGTVAQQLSRTFPYIITSDVLNEVVAESLGMDSVPASITADAMEDTALFTIRVRAAKPQLAYDVLQAVIENYPSVAEYIIGDTELTMIDESGVPQSPVNEPAFMEEAGQGTITGIVLSLVFLLVYAVTRRTVRREKDLASKVSLEFLGGIPQVQFKKRRKKKQQLILLDGKERIPVLGESLRTIRARVLKEIGDSSIKKILITSAAAGEGKTTFAVNFAISLARKGKKVILVDMDLRNPSVARTMDLKVGKEGIDTLLQKEIEIMPSALDDMLLSYEDMNLKVLPGIKSVKEPTKLLATKSMGTILDLLAEQADYVVIDTPPCGVMSDASIIAKDADSAIMVVRQDYTRIDRVLFGIENVVDTGVNLLGYILNGTEIGITSYGYGYGYNYGYGYGYGYGHRHKHAYGERKSDEK